MATLDFETRLSALQTEVIPLYEVAKKKAGWQLPLYERPLKLLLGTCVEWVFKPSDMFDTYYLLPAWYSVAELNRYLSLIRRRP